MNQFAKAFTPDKLEEAWHVFLTEFPMGLWETVYVTLLATLFAIVLGLPLGILLVTGDEKGIRRGALLGLLYMGAGVLLYALLTRQPFSPMGYLIDVLMGVAAGGLSGMAIGGLKSRAYTI